MYSVFYLRPLFGSLFSLFPSCLLTFLRVIYAGYSYLLFCLGSLWATRHRLLAEDERSVRLLGSLGEFGNLFRVGISGGDIIT